MTTITIDKEKCCADGACVAVCPMQILVMDAETAVPTFVPGGGEVCIQCGHCYAVCPSGAFKLSAANISDTSKDHCIHRPDALLVGSLLKGRRSVRVYKDTPISKQDIEKLIDHARYAPSGINRQPVNWAVVLGYANVQGLGEAVVSWMQGLLEKEDPTAKALRFDRLVNAWKEGRDRICRDAPALVIAYGLKDDPMVPQACTIAATYCELAAYGLGFGACWAGYVCMAINTSDEVRKAVGLSPRAIAGAVMMVGHPQYQYQRIPARKNPKILWR